MRAITARPATALASGIALERARERRDRLAHASRFSRVDPSAGARARVVLARASASGASSDPYAVLGVKPDADAVAVKRAYNSKQMLYKGEKAKLDAVEAAYETILQRGLSARLSGGKGAVSADVRFADRVVTAKWMPRACASPMKDVLVNFGLTMACAVVTLITPPQMRTLQVTIFAALLMVFRMFVKLVDVDPGPNATLDPAAAAKHNNMRFARSFGIVLGTFIVSLFCTFWLPQFIVEVLGLTVPAWMLLHQEVFVSVACGLVLAGLVSFYR